jgi:hypothetical protein
MDAKTLVLIAISLIWLLCLVACFLKAKYGMAIVGLVAAIAQGVGLPPIGGYYILNLIYPLWLLPFFGAMRLAHPKSYYANWFYRRNLHKYWRAVERFGLIEEYATMIAGDTELSTEFEVFLSWLLGRRKRTPEQKQRMMDSLKIARLEIFNRVHQHLPEQLRDSDEIARAIAEQINYATASPQFVGDDDEMQEKLETLVTQLRLNGANQAASEVISAVKMRSHYLALAESIMR